MSLHVWLLAFVSMVALDITWAFYTRTAAQARAFAAASWAVGLHGLGAFTTLAIVDDPRYLSATLLGAFLGTYVGIVWSRHTEKT